MARKPPVIVLAGIVDAEFVLETEQPPPFTATRKKLPFGSFSSIASIRFAADSLRPKEPTIISLSAGAVLILGPGLVGRLVLFNNMKRPMHQIKLPAAEGGLVPGGLPLRHS